MRPSFLRSTNGCVGKRNGSRLVKSFFFIRNCVLFLLALIILIIVPSILESPLSVPSENDVSKDKTLRRLFRQTDRPKESQAEDSLEIQDGITKICHHKESDRSHRKVLVTGSVGFIGFHVALGLVMQDDFVIGFDNYNKYYPVVLKEERNALLEAENVYTVRGDLNNTDLLKRILKECDITHIVHLAAQAGVRYAKEHPNTYIESNIHGTISLFEAARSVENPPQIIYASSSSVYGSNQKSPFSEDDQVDHPTSLYGSTKRSVELMAVVYHRLFHLSLTGLRFFTVYGPWGRPDMACFQFAKSILEQKTITIFRSPEGEELGRDFTYVDDIVWGILGAMSTSTPSTPTEATNRIFNLGNTSPVTVTDFVEKLEEALGKETTKEYKVLENSGDVLFTHADVSKAHASFNFTPSVSLKEGLSRFSSWFRNYASNMSLELWAYRGS